MSGLQRTKPVTEKDIPLEAIRGIAAITVVLCHSLGGFYPELVAPQASPLTNIFGEPWFFAVNGTGAVILFFVLSGYVLTRRYLLDGNANIIIRGAIKRWPRLAGPVLISTLLSFILFAFSAYSFMQAGKAVGSVWLAQDVMPVQNPSLIGAVAEGSFQTFFRAQYDYNGALWTMQPEFIGSFIAFGLALFLRQLREVGGSPLAASMILLLLVGFFHIQGWQYSIAFCMGVGLAYFIPREAQIRLPIAIGAAFAATYALGYTGRNVGAFVPFGIWDKIAAHPSYINTIGAVLIIATVEMHMPTRRLLSTRVMAIIGEMSFPVYLVHCLVICSAGAALYLATGSRPLAVLASILISPIAATPIMVFNRGWIKIANQLADSALYGVQSGFQCRQFAHQHGVRRMKSKVASCLGEAASRELSKVPKDSPFP